VFVYIRLYNLFARVLILFLHKYDDGPLLSQLPVADNVVQGREVAARIIWDEQQERDLEQEQEQVGATAVRYPLGLRLWKEELGPIPSLLLQQDGQELEQGQGQGHKQQKWDFKWGAAPAPEVAAALTRSGVSRKVAAPKLGYPKIQILEANNAVGSPPTGWNVLKVGSKVWTTREIPHRCSILFVNFWILSHLLLGLLDHNSLGGRSGRRARRKQQ
jgi:hypothetical protein